MAMTRQYGRVNIEVTVKKTELIERLKRNREKHAREFKQAIGLWQQDLDAVIKNLDISKQQRFPQELSRLQSNCPVSYLDEYDDIIDMFEMAVKEEILLDSEAFRNFCRDEWDWKSDIARNKYYQQTLE